MQSLDKLTTINTVVSSASKNRKIGGSMYTGMEIPYWGVHNGLRPSRHGVSFPPQLNSLMKYTVCRERVSISNTSHSKKYRSNTAKSAVLGLMVS